jgi:hypothetical protein
MQPFSFQHLKHIVFPNGKMKFQYYGRVLLELQWFLEFIISFSKVDIFSKNLVKNDSKKINKK